MIKSINIKNSIIIIKNINIKNSIKLDLDAFMIILKLDVKAKACWLGRCPHCPRIGFRSLVHLKKMLM
jgi:hypothetical protein